MPGNMLVALNQFSCDVMKIRVAEAGGSNASFESNDLFLRFYNLIFVFAFLLTKLRP